MAVPWIAVCTDAEGRRPGHPILDAGGRIRGRTAPRPACSARTSASGGPSRSRRPWPSSPPCLPRRLGLRDRGVLREGAFADLVVFDPATVADVATYEEPARHPVGIDHVVVNGRLAIRDGVETGERAGRLLRHAG